MYRIWIGTVKAYVVGEPNFFIPFGRAEYDSRKPILSDIAKEQVQPIVNSLNDGTISQSEAISLLQRI